MTVLASIAILAACAYIAWWVREAQPYDPWRRKRR
jgi:hypothetical protein